MTAHKPWAASTSHCHGWQARHGTIGPRAYGLCRATYFVYMGRSGPSQFLSGPVWPCDTPSDRRRWRSGFGSWAKGREKQSEKMAARGWICTDESAKEMLSRVSAERSLMLLPPLHRVPLRLGNVVEIAGPSPSAKTQILIQVHTNSHFSNLEFIWFWLLLLCLWMDFFNIGLLSFGW